MSCKTKTVFIQESHASTEFDSRRSNSLKVQCYVFVFTEVTLDSAPVSPENVDTQPIPRLLFGQEPSEQLFSKQSMEVVKMDQELDNFQKHWKGRRDAMLERHQQEQAGRTGLPFVTEKI